MSIKIITSNRKAFHEYTVSDKVEAGIALVGTEVKALRDGKANLADGWVDHHATCRAGGICRRYMLYGVSHDTNRGHRRNRCAGAGTSFSRTSTFC